MGEKIIAAWQRIKGIKGIRIAVKQQRKAINDDIASWRGIRYNEECACIFGKKEQFVIFGLIAASAVSLLGFPISKDGMICAIPSWYTGILSILALLTFVQLLYFSKREKINNPYLERYIFARTKFLFHSTILCAGLPYIIMRELGAIAPIKDQKIKKQNEKSRFLPLMKALVTNSDLRMEAFVLALLRNVLLCYLMTICVLVILAINIDPDEIAKILIGHTCVSLIFCVIVCQKMIDPMILSVFRKNRDENFMKLYKESAHNQVNFFMKIVGLYALVQTMGTGNYLFDFIDTALVLAAGGAFWKKIGRHNREDLLAIFGNL